MYTRTIQNEESGGAQSFRRGSCSIPASYAGTVFFTDSEPEDNPPPEKMPKTKMPDEETPDAAKAIEASLTAPDPEKQPDCTDDKPRGGILRGLIDRLDRGFEIDDLLLIGLILLLSRDRGKNSGETLILLAILFLTGF